MGRYVNFFKQVYFFNSLSDEDIANLESVCQQKRFKEGEVIFYEDSLGDNFFIIIGGTVEIWKDYGSVDQDLLAICGPGQSFGELALIDDSPRSATVVAREKVKLLSVDRDSFRQVISDSHPISLSIMKSITGMIRRSNDVFIENIKAKNRHLERAYAELKKESKERRRMEEALRNSSRRMCSILDSMPDMILELDKDMRIRWANKAALERNPDATDRFCYQAYWDSASPCENCASLRALKSGRIEVSTLFKSISEDSKAGNYWENIGIPLRDSRGEVTGILEVSRDITRRMQLEEELRHAQKMKAVATLSGGVAHEFNNLLMGIQGNVSLITAGMDESDPKYHKLKNIEKCVSRGADLTKKLLGISNRKKNRTEKTNINDLLQKTVSEKNLHIRQKYAHNLWRVEAEPQQISQVLSDILLNAWKTANGTGDLCLETENVVLNSENRQSVRLKNGRYVKISIADTDKIPSRNQIYDPFFAVRDMGNGSGLTLASAYSIVDDHGGAMYVYNEKGKGSMFEILLPCTEL